MASQTAVLTGALGALLGYIGSEVAETVVFERLLWPQRFYNDSSVRTMLTQGLWMTMGGPLHAAALKTLDVFRSNGLYRGAGHGHFLGTAFYSDSGVKYSTKSAQGNEHLDTDSDARNAFWLEVVSQLNRRLPNHHEITLPMQDIEKVVERNAPLFRAIQTVHHLTLRLASVADERDAKALVVEEHRATPMTYVSICLSETVAIACAVASIFLGAWWVAIYMSVPLLLKFISVLSSVRREGLESARCLAQNGSLDRSETFEMLDTSEEFLVIEGPATVVTQFFRHYGHPLRYGSSRLGSRSREVIGILLVYCFVLYFPAGLVLNIWMDDSIQYLWLAYQLYAVIGTHIIRLLGWQGCGRTEAKIARAFSWGKKVLIKSPGGATVVATVRTTYVPNVKSGMEMVKALMSRYEGGQHQTRAGIMQDATSEIGGKGLPNAL